ncbi:RNA polymerase III-inhibiting protein maf1 [Hypoxylon texense]
MDSSSDHGMRKRKRSSCSPSSSNGSDSNGSGTGTGTGGDSSNKRNKHATDNTASIHSELPASAVAGDDSGYETDNEKIGNE